MACAAEELAAGRPDVGGHVGRRQGAKDEVVWHAVATLEKQAVDGQVGRRRPVPRRNAKGWVQKAGLGGDCIVKRGRERVSQCLCRSINLNPGLGPRLRWMRGRGLYRSRRWRLRCMSFLCLCLSFFFRFFLASGRLSSSRAARPSCRCRLRSSPLRSPSLAELPVLDSESSTARLKSTRLFKTSADSSTTASRGLKELSLSHSIRSTDQTTS